MKAPRRTSEPLAKTFAGRARARSIRRDVEIGGVRTAYWFYPAAKTGCQDLLFIHGYRGTHSGLEAIAGLLSDFNVYIPDLPGFGDSDTLPTQTTLTAYARWLAEFRNRICPNADVVGHSYGTLAVGIAAAGHELTNSRLVLINPIGRVRRSVLSKFEAAVASSVYRLASQIGDELGRRLLVSRVVVRTMSVFMAKTQDRTLRRWIHAQHDEHFSQFNSVAVAVAGFETGLNTFLNDSAESINNSVSLILGELDEITPLADQLKLKLLFANVESHTVLGVGHLIHYEAPDQAAQLIRDFVIR